MINKLFWTKYYPHKYEQFEFSLPNGFKVNTVFDINVKSSDISTVNLGVTVKSDLPITLFFTPVIHSIDFRIVNPIQIIAPGVPTQLELAIINPNYNEDEDWVIKANSHIANMIVFNTSYTNLMEVSNNSFNKLS